MQDLAEFLGALHAVDVAAARRCGVRARDLRAQFVDVFARSEAIVAPQLTCGERKTFDHWFGAILGDPQTFAVRPTLIHGDMSSDHIFYDTASQRICGIIDFAT